MNIIKKIRKFFTRNKCRGCKFFYSCTPHQFQGCPYYQKGDAKETEAKAKRLAEQNELWKTVLGANENEKTP
jgi:hypothetical protein